MSAATSKMLISRLFLLAPFIISGCSAPVRAVTDYVRFSHGASQSVVAKTQLAPGYEYLLVTVKGKSFLMARGGVESSPEGPIEVWYSGNREVLRIQNGQVVSASGTPTEWSDVRISRQPDWSKISEPMTIERRRDVMPGYLFGLIDAVTISPIPAPSSTRFYGKEPTGLRWFKEVSTGPNALPASRYAVRFDGDRTEVIYGEQCLSESMCFSWQRWPTRT